VVKAFLEKDINRNSCTTWQWLCWIKLLSAITYGLKTLQSLLGNRKVDVLHGKIW